MLQKVGPLTDDETGGRTVFVFQNGRSIEEYVEEFIETSYQAICSDLTLMDGFRVGLEEDIKMVMPLGDPSWSLAQYLKFALWISGSAFQVGIMEIAPAPESSPNIPTTLLSSQSAVQLFSPPSSPSAIIHSSPPTEAHVPLGILVEYEGMSYPPVPAPRKCPPVPAPRKCPPVPAPPKTSPVPPLVPSSSPVPPLVLSSPPVPPLVPFSPPVSPMVPSSPPVSPLVPSSSPLSPLVPSSSALPERPQVSALPERPQVSTLPERPQVSALPELPQESLLVPSSSALPERPQESALPERPQESASPERPPESFQRLKVPNFIKKKLGGGRLYTRGPDSHSGNARDFGQGHYGSSFMASWKVEATESTDLLWPPKLPAPPWPPKLLDPPWPPESPDPPWPPRVFCSALDASPVFPVLHQLPGRPPPQWYCYGTGRAFREGEVLSRIRLAFLTTSSLSTLTGVLITCTCS
ncbi:uncharacterized protein LOC131529287 [Onychostoma macrolepis]|uniref:uncharacterized protein LOC131529287 n=1 Tax=Onychostoma macrolepis TaxID=369639 RepID=UPI00272D1793|nr:uncharacterized protein LOC131529287 [Onychostoma macrolepis]